VRLWGPNILFVAGYAKGKGKDVPGKKKGKSAATADAGPAPEFDMDEAEKPMDQAVQHYKAELSNIRSGRANPGLLEPVQVEAHGQRLPLRSFGAVTQRNAHLLVVVPFDPADSAAVLKALQNSPLKLQAKLEGKEVHVPMPRPTMEMLERMVKLVHQEAESAKAAVRNARHRALDGLKRAMKDHPDDRFRTEKEVQKLCDQYVAEIDRLKALKDKDIRENH